MRKLLYITLLVLPVFVFGAVGVSPRSEPAVFNFMIPEIVGVQISDASITWDFSSMAGFPPAAFPQPYEPTTPAARPHQAISYLVWGLGDGTTNWELTVDGNADPAPACGITLAEIEYAEDDGTGTLIGPWTSFVVAPGPAIDNGATSTGGWVTMYHDYQVNIDGDEIYPAGGTSSCTITYTIQTL